MSLWRFIYIARAWRQFLVSGRRAGRRAVRRARTGWRAGRRAQAGRAGHGAVIEGFRYRRERRWRPSLPMRTTTGLPRGARAPLPSHGATSTERSPGSVVDEAPDSKAPDSVVDEAPDSVVDEAPDSVVDEAPDARHETGSPPQRRAKVVAVHSAGFVTVL